MKLVLAVLVSLAIASPVFAAAQPAPAKTTIKVKFTPGVSMF